MKNFILILNFLFCLEVYTQNTGSQSEWPPGWTEKCLGCICEATSGCNQTIGCFGNFCGMFFISRPYWLDAGSPVLQGDNPDVPEGNECVSEFFLQKSVQMIHSMNRFKLIRKKFSFKDDVDVVSPDVALPFTRCALDSYCASRTVNQYVQKFVQDCNNDRRLSCDDYARLHYLGFSQCTRNIEDEAYYRNFRQCFLQNPTQIST